MRYGTVVREWRGEIKKGWVIGCRDCNKFVRTGVSQPTQSRPLTLCW